MGNWPDHYRFKFSDLPKKKGLKRLKRGYGRSFEPFETEFQGGNFKNYWFLPLPEKCEMKSVYQEKNHG